MINVRELSSKERGDHREWIGGMALTTLSHYYRDNDAPPLAAEIGRQWADVLEQVPRPFLQKASIIYLQQNPRKKPTPGAIYEIAKSLMVKPSAPPLRDPDPHPPKETPEEIERRRQFAKSVLKEAGFRPKRFDD